jgi:HAD superfamily hydrolase (TIGR01490 family)
MTALAPKLVAFKIGIVKNTQAKEAAIGRFLAGRTEAELRDAAESFARDVIPRLLRDEAMRRLEWHRREGHAVAVASASLELYLRPWTDAAGIEHLAATRIGLDGGRVTGRLLGANCHGPEKVVRLREMFPDLGERIVHAYGDSSGDRELLAIARHAHYRRFPAEAEVG